MVGTKNCFHIGKTGQFDLGRNCRTSNEQNRSLKMSSWVLLLLVILVGYGTYVNLQYLLGECLYVGDFSVGIYVTHEQRSNICSRNFVRKKIEIEFFIYL